MTEYRFYLSTELPGEVVGHADGTYSLTYDGVQFAPKADPVALGTLCFGLKPDGFRFRSPLDPASFMHTMLAHAFELHYWTHSERLNDQDLPRFTFESLTDCVDNAPALAPPNYRECVEALIRKNLGPNAWPWEQEKFGPRDNKSGSE